MNHHETEPLPDDLIRALHHESELPAQSPEMRARVRARLELRARAMADAAGPSSPATPPSAGLSTLAKIGVGAAIAATFASGVALGYVMRGDTTPPLPSPPAPVRSIEPPSPRQTPSEPWVPDERPPEPSPTPPSSTHRIERPVAPRPSREHMPTEESDPTPISNMAAERSILDAARSARDPAQALSTLDRHAQHYPHGALEEEREALRVRWLVEAGQLDRARATARTFERRFPSSLYLRQVRAAVRDR